MPSGDKAQHDRTDILLSYSGVLVSGLLGLALPIVIGSYYGPESLGVFNQALALMLVFGQVAAFGIHLSVLRSLPGISRDRTTRSQHLTAALLAALPFSLVAAIVLAASDDAIGSLMHSNALASAITWVALGLFFFSINKLFLAALNALSRFKEYAIYSNSRYVLMFAGLLGAIVLDVDGNEIAAILPITEIVLFLLLFRSLKREIAWVGHGVWRLVGKHLRFGLRAGAGHIMVNVNTRIDVLFLGYFADDATVGIYSLAAILAEGAYQLPIVMRTIHTPRVVKLLDAGDYQSLSELVRITSRRLWLGMLAIGIPAILLYPIVLPVLTGHAMYADGVWYFAVIMAGVIIASGYTPYGLLFANAGRPGLQSWMHFLLISTNIVGNSLLIPAVGAIGAAVSTALSHVLSLVLLKVLARRYLTSRLEL